MQKIMLYATANETLASVRDSANARSASSPVFVRGVEVELHLRLFANANEQERYVLPSGIVSYGWYMDVDFDTTTAFKIVGDNADIVVVEIPDTVDPDTGEITEYGYTDIQIPITNMNSEALVEWLGTNKSMTGLIGELCGYDSTGASIFVLQIEGFTVRNRLSDTGEPSPNVENYLTLDEARALFMSDNKALRPYLDVEVLGGGNSRVDGHYTFYDAYQIRSNVRESVFVRDDGQAFVQYVSSLGGWIIYSAKEGEAVTARYRMPWILTASNPGPISGFWENITNPSNYSAQVNVVTRYNIAAQTY